jgi:hypothetical protein
MKKFLVSLLLSGAAVPAFATVNISAPTNYETTGPSVQFVASATTTCSKGVASMGVYVDNNRYYVVGGASMNATLTLPTGTHNTVVQEWDYCGGSSAAARTVTVTTTAGVNISSPANGATVGSPVNFVASATTSCSAGVSAMGVYVNNNLIYTVQGASLNTQLSLGAGWNYVVIQDWDKCGGVSKKALNVDVTGSSGNTIWAIQGAGGWNKWGELPPTMNICNAPCNYQVGFSMQQHEGSVSKSGNGTQFSLWGTTPYSAVLFSNPILGQGSWINTDSNHTLIPKLHNFTVNADIYVTNPAVTQAIELDINMYLNSLGLEWGTQCNHLADNSWDYWDNVNAHWVSSGAPCKLNSGWNHVTLQVQRESNNWLLYQTITMNGVTYTLNKSVPPMWVPSSWYGMTLNYQMDGNYNMSSNTTYVDNLNVTYW